MAHTVSGTASQAKATGTITIADTTTYDGLRASYALLLQVKHREVISLVATEVDSVDSFSQEPDTDGEFIYTLAVFDLFATNPDPATLSVEYHLWSVEDGVLYQVVEVDGVNELALATEIPEDWEDRAHLRVLNVWNNEVAFLDSLYADLNTGAKCPCVSEETVLLEKKRIAATAHFYDYNCIQTDRLLE